MDIVTGNGEKNLTLKNCTYKTTRGKSDIIARIRAKKFGVKNYVNRVSRVSREKANIISVKGGKKLTLKNCVNRTTRVEPLHASDSRNGICHSVSCTPLLVPYPPLLDMVPPCRHFVSFASPPADTIAEKILDIGVYVQEFDVVLAFGVRVLCVRYTFRL